MAKPVPWLVPAVWTGGLTPFVGLGLQAANDELGANPISTALNRLGMLSLIFLIATLACTPLQKLFGWTWPPRIRKALGLLGFTYVTAHFLVYLVLDQGFSLGTLVEDVFKRPFVTVGFVSWLLLIPLALTSFNSSVKKLGFEKWKRLHRLAYVCAALGVWHFWWRVKKDVTEPLIYGAVLAVLLGLRVMWSMKKRRAA